MPVVQPYMKPREYGDLDVFTNYWASYTGARSAKWEQRMQLMLKQMDNSQADDLIKDLRSRRRDLEAEMRRLTRTEISDVSRKERDSRKSARKSGLPQDAQDYIDDVGEYAKFNATMRDRADSRTLQEIKRLDAEEERKTDETQNFMYTMDTSYAKAGVARDIQGVNNQQTINNTYASYLAGLPEGGSETQRRDSDAHAMALYQHALENGHNDAAAHIAENYPGFQGQSPNVLLDQRTHTTEEMASIRKKRLEQASKTHGVSVDRIYKKGLELYEKHGTADSEEIEASKSSAVDTEKPQESAADLVATQKEKLKAEMGVLDTQIAALTAANRSQKAMGLNSIQQMMNQNWNFAPYAIAPDKDAQEFIDQISEYDPLRVGTFMEDVDLYGSPRALQRARDRGEVSPYDPITTTSVREYATADQGAFVFGYLHDEVQGIEQLLSQPGGEANIVEAYAKIIGLSAQTSRIGKISSDSDVFTRKLTPFAQNLGPLWQSDDSAFRKRFMGAGYREVTNEKDEVIRQYGDGQITFNGVVVDGDAAEELKLADAFDGPIDPQNFTGFDHQREGLPPMDDVLAEIGNLRSVAQAEMGADDRMFGELMSVSLNKTMASPDPSTRMKGIYETNQLVSQLSRNLVGDRAVQLAQTMELTAARGDMRGLFDEIDKIIESGQDQLVRDQEFAEYMKEYGPTIEAGPQELVDRSRGAIQPRKEDLFAIGEGLEPLTKDRRAFPGPEEETRGEGAARAQAFETMRKQPTPATPAATLLSIPYLTRMSEEGRVEAGRIEELKAAIEAIEFGDPETAKQSAESARQILLEQEKVSLAMLDEAQQEHKSLVEGFDDLPSFVEKKIKESEYGKGFQPSPEFYPEMPSVGDLVERRLAAIAKGRGYGSYAAMKLDMLTKSLQKAQAQREPLKAIYSDLLKLDVHASGAGEVSMEGELPQHVQKIETLGVMRAKYPIFEDMPDDDLWKAISTQDKSSLDAWRKQKTIENVKKQNPELEGMSDDDLWEAITTEQSGIYEVSYSERAPLDNAGSALTAFEVGEGRREGLQGRNPAFGSYTGR